MTTAANPGQGRLDALRDRLGADLPGRVAAAMAAYARFTADEPPADAKGFAAWQAAAKAALGHVEVLVKLLRWAEGRGSADMADPAEDGLDGLLDRARDAVGRWDDTEDAEDGD